MIRRGGPSKARALLGTGMILATCVALPGREFPPQVPAPKPVVVPAPAVRTLANGLKVVVIERHTTPLLTLRLVVKAGTEADAVPGTAQLVASLLTQGTARRTAREIAEAIDWVGGTLSASADRDASGATATVLSDRAELAYDLLSDVALRPVFHPPEVERKRQQTLSALEVLRDDPSQLADEVFHRVIFAGTPYGHPLDGTPESVRRITVQNLKEFHHSHYRPSNSVLAVVGDITPGESFARAHQFFGEWAEAPSRPAPRAAAGPPSSRREIVVIDKPDAVQTEVRVGNLGIPRASPDYPALTVANQILGGPATNRLFKALRSQAGLTYGASSELECNRTLGAWVAKTFTRTPETGRIVQLVLEQMKRFRERPLSGAELHTAQGYLVGHMALEFETSESLADKILELMTYDLPLDYWSRFPESIQGLDTDTIWNATRRSVDPDRAVIVLVGNASGFLTDLKKLGPVRVIPWRRLDLGSPTLEAATPGAGK